MNNDMEKLLLCEEKPHINEYLFMNIREDMKKAGECLHAFVDFVTSIVVIIALCIKVILILLNIVFYPVIYIIEKIHVNAMRKSFYIKNHRDEYIELEINYISDNCSTCYILNDFVPFYLMWKETKQFKYIKLIVDCSFGIDTWYVYRFSKVIKNLLTGKYEEIVKKNVKGYYKKEDKNVNRGAMQNRRSENGKIY